MESDMKLTDRDTFTYDHGAKFRDDDPHYTYRIVQGHSGNTWLIPTNTDYPAENVHVDQHDPRSRGYAGGMLSFPLEDGTTYSAKGPWHSNAESLYNDTGVDIRATYRTYGCVALKMRYDNRGNGIFEELIYVNREPTIGPFDRITDIAQTEADKRGHPIAACSISRGGGMMGYEYPNGTSSRDWMEWFDNMKKKNSDG
jgi:hypothetical protein